MSTSRLRLCGMCNNDVHSPAHLQQQSHLTRKRRMYWRRRKRFSSIAFESGCGGSLSADVILDKISSEYPLLRTIKARDIGCKGSEAIPSSGLTKGRRLNRTSSLKNSDAFDDMRFDLVNPTPFTLVYKGSAQTNTVGGSTETQSLTLKGWKSFDIAHFDNDQAAAAHRNVDQKQNLKSVKPDNGELFEDEYQIRDISGKSKRMQFRFNGHRISNSRAENEYHAPKHEAGLKKHRKTELRTTALSSRSHEGRKTNKTKRRFARHGLRSNLHRQPESDNQRLLPDRDRSDIPERNAAFHLADRVALHKSVDDDKKNVALEDYLERFAFRESVQTTRGIQSCVKLAEKINAGVTNTLTTVHRQGDQITRAQEINLDIDQDLSVGEKLLGSLGGIFSRTWKPAKSLVITGPILDRKASFQRRNNHVVQRRSLDLTGINRKEKTHLKNSLLQPESRSTKTRLQSEQKYQDEALVDLSNVLSQLKSMSLDVGKELSRQNEALNPFQDEVMELVRRIKRANVRGRHLLAQ